LPFIDKHCRIILEESVLVDCLLYWLPSVYNWLDEDLFKRECESVDIVLSRKP
jgi:hypothetical protein